MKIFGKNSALRDQIIVGTITTVVGGLIVSLVTNWLG